jgi:hypothetical protein
MAGRQDAAGGGGPRRLTRRLLAVLLAAAALPTRARETCLPAQSAAGATDRCVRYPGFTPPGSGARCSGCGCRGGPGCRKADGSCASWRDRVVPDCRARR